MELYNVGPAGPTGDGARRAADRSRFGAPGRVQSVPNSIPLSEPTMTAFSMNPAGEKFALPERSEYAAELERLGALARNARADGQEVVVVMGVGFVGAVMAAIVADSTDETGRPTKFVIGCQRPSTRSYWKIPMLNRGVSPVKAEDPTVDALIRRCVLERKTLTATYNSDCLALADCVVVDVQCDYVKRDLGNLRTGDVDMAALEATLKTIGERSPPQCLTLIETRARRHAPARSQLRASHARPGIRGQHPRLLASLQRLRPRGPRARRQVPEGSPEHRGIPADRARPAHRVRDREDRREFLSRHDPRLPQ
jgi:hypothetical protein